MKFGLHEGWAKKKLGKRTAFFLASVVQKSYSKPTEIPKIFNKFLTGCKKFIT